MSLKTISNCKNVSSNALEQIFFYFNHLTKGCVYFFAFICITKSPIGQCFINGVLSVCVYLHKNIKWHIIRRHMEHHLACRTTRRCHPLTTLLLCSCSGSVWHDDTLNSWPSSSSHTNLISKIITHDLDHCPALKNIKNNKIILQCPCSSLTNGLTPTSLRFELTILYLENYPTLIKFFLFRNPLVNN